MNRLLLILIITATALFAEPKKPSVFASTPATTHSFINLNPQNCDKWCLEELIEDEKIFSFLARYDQKNATSNLNREFQRYSSTFSIKPPSGIGTKMAVIIPSETIGRYSAMISSSVTSFLIFKNEPFEFMVFDSKDESVDSLKKALEEATTAGYSRIIAGLTLEGVANLSTIPINAEIFVPTVNINELDFEPPANLFFGGIDYGIQLEKLSGYAYGFDTVLFEEKTGLSQRISSFADATCPTIPKRITIDNPRVNFSSLFKTRGVGDGTTLLLNTQPVRTSLILSQVTYNDLNISAALSTQINYSPLILTLTQSHDVEKFFVASTIGRSDDKLQEINAIMQNDLRFNWIPYATAVLADFIYQRQKGDFFVRSRLFDVAMQNNQLDYKVNIYQIKNGRFELATDPAIWQEQFQTGF